MPRPIDDLGPDFDRRWRQASLPRRREFIAELRDLYLMLEQRDEPLLARLRNGSIPPPRDDDPPLLLPEQAAGQRQASLFDDTVATAPPLAPATAPARENPFLPRSVLDRLQQNRRLAAAGVGAPLVTPPVPPAASAAVASAPPLPASHEQSDLERELRLKLGPLVETLIEAQMEMIKSELRVRLRLEMDRLIAEHLRK